MTTTAKKFPKVKKKYALNNSYFKFRAHDAPSDPYEVHEYFKEHGEYPFEAGYVEDPMYECFVEYQKRNGVSLSQFFTPPATARRIAKIASDYFEIPLVLDACCGFGMLSKALVERELVVIGFDLSDKFQKIYQDTCNGGFAQSNFRDMKHICMSSIVSNPPYEVKECGEFLECLLGWLSSSGTAVLLLPKGFVDKERPKQLVTTLQKFKVIHREDMEEDFARTNIKAEIVVLRKK